MITIYTEKLLIQHLKEKKGIIFDKYSEECAQHFLEEHNYYLKLTAYRTNFAKHRNRYVGLDFKALVDLSTIDMHLKQFILKASLSIEHSMKVNLLHDISARKIDKYAISKHYLDQYDRVLPEIEKRREKSYVDHLLQKHKHPDYPIYVLLEVISFGEFVNFYRYYCKEYSYKSIDFQMLYAVRDIRNAAAHNNCIIHNLGDKSGYFNKETVEYVSQLAPSLKRRTIQNRLKNKTIQDFVSLLIAIQLVIKSDKIKAYLFKDITILFQERMVRNKDLYNSSPVIQQAYAFTKEVLDTMRVVPYTKTTN